MKKKLLNKVLKDDWLIDKEAEFIMSGLSEKEAKEAAMNDWYTYRAANEDYNSNITTKENT